MNVLLEILPNSTFPSEDIAPFVKLKVLTIPGLVALVEPMADAIALSKLADVASPMSKALRLLNRLVLMSGVVDMKIARPAGTSCPPLVMNPREVFANPLNARVTALETPEVAALIAIRAIANLVFIL
jgi:hypothetical protein